MLDRKIVTWHRSRKPIVAAKREVRSGHVVGDAVNYFGNPLPVAESMLLRGDPPTVFA